MAARELLHHQYNLGLPEHPLSGLFAVVLPEAQSSGSMPVIQSPTDIAFFRRDPHSSVSSGFGAPAIVTVAERIMVNFGCPCNYRESGAEPYESSLADQARRMWC